MTEEDEIFQGAALKAIPFKNNIFIVGCRGVIQLGGLVPVL